jgi:hypothetical protein
VNDIGLELEVMQAKSTVVGHELPLSFLFWLATQPPCPTPGDKVLTCQCLQIVDYDLVGSRGQVDLEGSAGKVLD